MDLVIFKLLAIVLIIGGAILGGLLPLRIEESERGERITGFCNAFAGGVFLGAGLLHLLVDGQDHFEHADTGISFPVVPLIAGGGLLGALFLEKVAAPGAGEAGGQGHRTQTTYPLILLIVLSAHSVIAGMTLGLEREGIAFLGLLVAIVGHKAVAAFALGVSLKSAGVARRSLVRRIALFSAMTPLGLLIGILTLELQSGENELTEATFNGIAAGTFLYIAISDILAEVFEDRRDRAPRFGFVGIGFAVMALLAIWA